MFYTICYVALILQFSGKMFNLFMYVYIIQIDNNEILYTHTYIGTCYLFPIMYNLNNV